MPDHTAISGTRRAIKELVDGTIRVSIDVDPQHRRAFFELFPDIDSPVALAPLVQDFERPVEAKPKGGELAKLAGIFCSDPSFQKWLKVPDEDGAAAAIRATCGVNSRAELDHNPKAAALFHERIRKPWLEHRQ